MHSASLTRRRSLWSLAHQAQVDCWRFKYSDSRALHRRARAVVFCLQAQRPIAAQRSGPAWVSGILEPARSRSAHQFDSHLDRTLGCAPRTRGNYVSYARRFLNEAFGDAEIEWQKLSADVIVNFVQREAVKLQSVSSGQPVTAMRALLRFLTSAGVIPAGLTAAVPSVRTWRHSVLPRAVSADEVEHIIMASDPNSDYGLRERAIVLLLARLGLRACEVIRLRIDDIDWDRGCVLIRAGKNHRERSLPLCQEVGDAIVAYLKKARPASSHRELFLRWTPPFRPLRSSVSICNLVQKLLRRAGISVHRPGAHVFRHSLATHMVIGGGTFKEIADVLGHQSLVTTEIYAKLDLNLLSEVAMPWPGGNQ